jgi:hypothetical protein
MDAYLLRAAKAAVEAAEDAAWVSDWRKDWRTAALVATPSAVFVRVDGAALRLVRAVSTKENAPLGDGALSGTNREERYVCVFVYGRAVGYLRRREER